jgi:hypothetical protein
MNNFIEVFVFTQFENAILPIRFFQIPIGIVIFIVGISLFRKVKREQGCVPEILKAVFLLFWAIIWVGIHGLLLGMQVVTYLELLNIYNNHLYSVVEGKVQVIHEQPSGGHDRGDLIIVGDKEFEFSYFEESFGYHQTISNGGVLKEGVYARLTYCENPSPYETNNVILRVEILEIK